MLPYTPAALTLMFSWDNDRTNRFPNAVVTAVMASDVEMLLTIGTKSDGTVTVRFTDLLPIVVLPDLVVTVTVAVADVPEIASIHSFGIMNAVPDVIVLLYVPSFTVSISLKLLDFFVAVAVTVVDPSAGTLDLSTDKSDTRGIVVNAFDAVADIVPAETPVVYDALADTVFLPAESCVTHLLTVHSSVVVPLLKLCEKLYLVPSSVMLPGLLLLLYDAPVAVA